MGFIIYVACITVALILRATFFKVAFPSDLCCELNPTKLFSKLSQRLFLKKKKQNQNLKLYSATC